MPFEIVLESNSEISRKYPNLIIPQGLDPLEGDMVMPVCAIKAARQGININVKFTGFAGNTKCVNDLLMTKPREPDSESRVVVDFSEPPVVSNCAACIIYQERRSFMDRLKSLTTIFQRGHPLIPGHLPR